MLNPNTNYSVTVKKHYAFTLIELLVVISIIVLLIAMLLPALKAARDNAKNTMCMSNVHQLVLAMTNYAIDEEGFYPAITPKNQLWMPPGVTCWQNWCSYGAVNGGEAVAYARLFKTDYLNNWWVARCPMRRYEWPAKDIDNFLDPPPWPFDGPLVDADGEEFPERTCYQMRGWEKTAGDWRTPDQRQAISGDMINCHMTVVDMGHPTGVGIGYSDASITHISKDTPYNEVRTFEEQLLTWSPACCAPIGVLAHLEAYKWFDTQ